MGGKKDSHGRYHPGEYTRRFAGDASYGGKQRVVLHRIIFMLYIHINLCASVYVFICRCVSTYIYMYIYICV